MPDTLPLPRHPHTHVFISPSNSFGSGDTWWLPVLSRKQKDSRWVMECHFGGSVSLRSHARKEIKRRAMQGTGGETQGHGWARVAPGGKDEARWLQRGREAGDGQGLGKAMGW